MASLARIKARGAGGRPTWRIQFYDGAGQRRAVYLGAVPKKAAEVWVSRVEQLNACLVAGVAPDTDLAGWVASLPDSTHHKLVRAGLAEPRAAARKVVTLGQLTEAFVARSTTKPATVQSFQQTLDSLTAFFGAGMAVDAITAEDADKWRAWVVRDKKGSGRRRKKRTTSDNRLAAATVAKRVSVAKQVFKAGIRWGWLAKNPFADLRSGSQSNPARARYVSPETIRDILDACPSADWRLLVALARLAGLRCPSEIGALTWGDINWEKGRLTVLAKKTEHHGGEHAVRVVPVCPELRTILADAFEQAEAGATLIVPMAARKSVNLRTHMERIIAKAGHQPWPRLFQNLRASCETDWVERYPAHAVAKWLGHSPKVAAEHYLMSREHHFQDVVGGGDRQRRVPEATAPTLCDANCDAIATRIASPQAYASESTTPHETTEPAATTGVSAGSSEIRPIKKKGPMGDIGLEPMTPSLSS